MIDSPLLFVALIFIAFLFACAIVLVVLSRNMRLLFYVEEESKFIAERGVRKRINSYFANLVKLSGAELLPREAMLISVVLSSLGILGGLAFTGEAHMSLTFGVMGFLVLPLLLSSRGKANQGKFEEMLGDAMPLVASNLRAGLTMRQALLAVAENTRDPIRQEFFRLVEEAASGVPMADALDSLAGRTGSTDLRLFAAAVSIQANVGGSIADITDQVGATIRERLEMRQMVKSKTSMVKISTLIMSVIPILIFFAVMGMSEIHRSFYLSPDGVSILMVCGILMGVGWLVLKKMGNLDD